MKNTYKYYFDIECIESGQRAAYGDSFYSYLITSDLPENEVMAFCMHVLKRSYIKDKMPDPFCGQLLEFVKITENNKGKTFFDKREKETYSYKVRCEYTD
jgi:hypothetical protein